MHGHYIAKDDLGAGDNLSNGVRLRDISLGVITRSFSTIILDDHCVLKGSARKKVQISSHFHDNLGTL